jgi:hypothetical protein
MNFECDVPDCDFRISSEFSGAEDNCSEFSCIQQQS